MNAILVVSQAGSQKGESNLLPAARGGCTAVGLTVAAAGADLRLLVPRTLRDGLLSTHAAAAPRGVSGSCREGKRRSARGSKRVIPYVSYLGSSVKSASVCRGAGSDRQ